MFSASHPERITEKDIFGAAVADISAGTENVSATSQAVIYNLLARPEDLERVQDEIDAAQARGEPSNLVQYHEAARLPFLQSFQVALLTNSWIILSVHLWVIHRNPDSFGQDCDPSRWFQDDRVMKEVDALMIYWGAGYNQGPGRNLAQFELSKVLATVL
ncbi:cytochrome P450 [Aspergillus varians]